MPHLPTNRPKLTAKAPICGSQRFLSVNVSLAGDIVTATLHTGPHRPTYVRLVPMGVGYRYAGRGIWLDGLRENAILNLGKNSSVACTVTTP